MKWIPSPPPVSLKQIGTQICRLTRSLAAARTDDDRFRPGERRRDDFLSSRRTFWNYQDDNPRSYSVAIADRGPMSHREDLPLPTEPPYTAFVGNLAFDLIETDLEEFFAGTEVRYSCRAACQHPNRPKA